MTTRRESAETPEPARRAAAPRAGDSGAGKEPAKTKTTKSSKTPTTKDTAAPAAKPTTPRTGSKVPSAKPVDAASHLSPAPAAAEKAASATTPHSTAPAASPTPPAKSPAPPAATSSGMPAPVAAPVTKPAEQALSTPAAAPLAAAATSPASATPTPAPAPAPAPAAPLDAGNRHERIALLAYLRYERRGCIDGFAEEDWAAAEAEVDAEDRAPATR